MSEDKRAISFVEPQDSTETLPDELRDALGQILAEERRQWRRERELIQAQAQKEIFELRATIAELRSEVRHTLGEWREDFAKIINGRLTELKDGAPGKDGVPGPQGEPGPAGADGAIGPRGERGLQGERGEAGLTGAAADIAHLLIEMKEWRDGIESEIRNRLADLKDGTAGPQGPPGESIVGPMGPTGVPGESIAGPQGERGIDGADGKDADPEVVARIVGDLIDQPLKAYVLEQVKALPLPKDGERGPAGERGEAGRDGLDVDMNLVLARIDEQIKKLPPAKDGERGPAGELGLTGPVGPPGERGADGRDGKDADMNLITNLILTEIDKRFEAMVARLFQRQSDLSDDEFFSRVETVMKNGSS